MITDPRMVVPQPVWSRAARLLPPDCAVYAPKTNLGRIVKHCFPYLPPDLAEELLDKILSAVVIETSLSLVVFRTAQSPFGRGRREIEDYGVVSRKVVTDTGVNAITDSFQNIIEPEIYNFHGIGTGGAAEAVGNTALTTELTTQYNPDNTRATGAQSEPAANQYRSIGTNTVDATAAVTEHGLFSVATSGSGVMMDRSLFSVINLAASDSLQSTWTMTFTSGG